MSIERGVDRAIPRMNGAIRRFDVGETWHVMEAPLAAQSTPLAALERNRTLGGLAKIALAADGTWQVRAEIPHVDGMVSPRCQADTEAGIAAVLGIVPTAPSSEPTAPSSERGPVAPLAPPALLALGLAAGFPCTALADGRIAVDLGLRGRVARARIARIIESRTGGLRVSAELDCVPTPFAEPCGRALAILLARAAVAVRLVRPVVDTRPGHAVIAFEARYAGAAPAPAALAHALAALGVAADLTSREVRVLARDPALAAAYLRFHDLNRVGLPGPTPTAGATPAHEGGPR